MNESIRDRHARSFDAAAEAYRRARPGYPEEALDWLLPPAARRVLDLGAGTGKLTAQLLTRGLDVVAVEPLPGMRAQLAATTTGADIRDGTAETIPLPDADIDAVLVAQAWHWFDHDRALPEIARVLRPGGTLGLLWHSRDEREPWVAELSAVMRRGSARGLHARRLPGSRYFGPHEERDFGFSQDVDAATLRDYVRSRSYVIVRPEPERADLLDAVERLTRTHPALAGRTTFALPHLTCCYRATRV